MSGAVHVRPIDDLVEHELSSECVCIPSPELVDTNHGDEWLYVHHSLDGRESKEGK